MIVLQSLTPSQPRGVPGLRVFNICVTPNAYDGPTYQNIASSVFNVPPAEVELHALVYGERTASGMAGGRAGV